VRSIRKWWFSRGKTQEIDVRLPCRRIKGVRFNWKWKQDGMNCPQFFLIGAPKCGTSALAHYLSEHPSVCFSCPKEPYYWADDFPGLQRQFGVRSLQEYEQLFAGRSDRTVLYGEGSTVYLASSSAVARILEYQPDAKFIVMLRNPVDLASSLHAQQISHLNEDEPSFEVAWTLQEERKQGRKIPADCYEPELLQYRRIASLGRQVEQLLHLVARERVLFLFFDDFQSSPGDIYQSAVRFLELPRDNREEFPRINEGKLPRIRWLTKALNGKRGTSVSRYLKRRLKGRLFTLADRSKKALTMRQYARPPLPSEFRQQLIAEFSDEVRLLAEVTRRQLSGWCQ